VIENYILDTRTFELATPGHGKVRLTPLQFDLLYHLMTHPGETFSPSRLLDEVWDFPSGKGSPDLVRVHIKTLRERIESDPSLPTFIRTVPGRGYTVGSLLE
jgi:DNA-binding response OmpR family regulator